MVAQPDFGGQLKEGLIGQPRFINPLYLSDNDPDRDLVEILFSGLLKHNGEGKIVKDLTESYQVSEDGRTYRFQLKDKLFWQDGAPLTAEDVVFTVNLVQSPQYKSSSRVEWLGVRVEKEGPRKIVFNLQKSYSSFLETVARLKILPQHIFQEISPESLPWALSAENHIVGSGPFKLKNIKEDKAGFIEKITLERNENFHGRLPYLKEISFYFYQNFEDLIKGARTGEINAFAISDPRYLGSLEKEGFPVYRISLPRYFALFFNLNPSRLLSEKALREALSFGVDKEEILKKVFLGKGEIVNSPVLAGFYGFQNPEETVEFNLEKSKEILEKEGFRENPETGFREKLQAQKLPSLFKRDLVVGNEGSDVRELQTCLSGDKEVYPEGEITGYFGPKTKAAVIRFQEKYAEEILQPIGLKRGTGKVGGMTRDKLDEICQDAPKEVIPLKFTITTTDKFPLTDIARVLKEQFKKIGAEVEIEKVSLSEFQTRILAKRDFESLLFGEAQGTLPDPFPFWHSSQRDYPGLNITGFASKAADKFLEKARETLDEEEKKESLEKFQDVLVKEMPAIFLARPNYFYVLSPEIKGFSVEKITEPAERLTGIENLYIKTKRVWK